MNKQTFIQLIKNPNGITQEQLLELEKLVGGFPYCQIAHILIAKQASDSGSMLADQKVKYAAAYTLDRKNLKKLLATHETTTAINTQTVILKELPPLEVPKVEVVPVTTKEEVSTSFVKSEDSIAEEISGTTKPKEALTDEKRDEIIRELQENLKRLHTIKLKTAWEDVPKEIEVIGINTEKPSEEKQETMPVLEISKEVEPAIEIDKVIGTDETHDIKPIVETKPLTTEIYNPTQPFLYNTFVATSSTYPIRIEDVLVDIKEIEEEQEIMNAYFQYLDEKRGIFRKNKKKEGAIIEKIIKDDPTIPKLDINNLPDNSVDLSTKSITISKGPVSENFAKILAIQGKTEKAIEIYEQLILKNPEKKPYFEALIEKLKNKL